jgi:hypothetical protein
MDLSRHVVTASVAVALCVSIGACGSASIGPGGPPPGNTGGPSAESTLGNDSALYEAADGIQPLLEKSFADSYSGLKLDLDARQIIVYRRSDPALDSTVRNRVSPKVRIVFRDAKFTSTQMQRLANRIIADTDYWRHHGIEIQSAGPKVDGTGVNVGTKRGPADAPGLLRHYGAGTLTVEKMTVAPV